MEVVDIEKAQEPLEVAQEMVEMVLTAHIDTVVAVVVLLEPVVMHKITAPTQMLMEVKVLLALSEILLLAAMAVAVAVDVVQQAQTQTMALMAGVMEHLIIF